MTSQIFLVSNIFESFLPQLLTYPNPIDPLNGDAAAMYLHKPEEYKKKVTGEMRALIVKDFLITSFGILDYVKRFATEEALREAEKNEQSSDDESSMSDFSEDDMAKDMEL
jgi:ubiquitin-conjugating enzyme E2 H